jgi:polyribonucleotide nucleotidyltransferase
MLGDKSITIETGRLAKQAGGAVTVQLGESVIFAAATMSPNPREGADFFPLTIEYEEKMYAGGRIPGSFFRKEGRPTEEAILTARLTDRPLRPLFSMSMRNEVQVILFTISSDGINPLDVLAINAASAALMISDIPWDGPVGAVRISRLDGKFIVDPTFSEVDASDLDLRIAGTRDAIIMVECGAKEVNEADMVAALEFGHQALQPIIDLQLQMAKELGKPKRTVVDYGVAQAVKDNMFAHVEAAVNAALEAPHTKAELNASIDSIQALAISEIANGDETLVPALKEAFEDAYKRVVRARIIERGARPDGRALDEIRPIWCEVGVSPRAHGSGLFTRGETQVMTLATLGTPKEAQELDTLSPTESKRYMHHYNFPPYSTDEVKMLRGSSRREIGHGALAERALLPVIPPESEFPYTLRLVSEVLSSNGSSSMASVCGSTLALMDTGVPIKAPVAGVAMGLIKEGDQHRILTDIQGLEDHLGDMDFKVAGTDKGITALQMDIKIKGITPEILSEALSQANKARRAILDKILEAIPAPRPELKPQAPRITVIKVPVEKIGAIIGPGGKNIRSLQEETHTKIDISDDGSVFIAAIDGIGEARAREIIEGLTETPQIGRIYTGKVVRIADFGAFVEILPNLDGMVHISQLDTERVEKVEDVVQMGDEISVMVTDIDPAGKIRLSRQAVLEGWTPEEANAHDRKGHSGSGRPSGGGRSGSGGHSGDRRSGSGGGFNRR